MDYPHLRVLTPSVTPCRFFLELSCTNLNILVEARLRAGIGLLLPLPLLAVHLKFVHRDCAQCALGQWTAPPPARAEPSAALPKPSGGVSGPPHPTINISGAPRLSQAVSSPAPIRAKLECQRTAPPPCPSRP